MTCDKKIKNMINSIKRMYDGKISEMDAVEIALLYLYKYDVLDFFRNKPSIKISLSKGNNTVVFYS